MPVKNRNDLKSFFVKNAIPTEGNFADLIDSQLNQSVDGIFKLEGEPLSIVAAATQQKRALRLYADYPAANPDWMISLNPGRPGLGFTDGAGNTWLFIDAATGQVGVGTNAPQFSLDVAAGARANGFRGRYDLALADFRTVNPATNVCLVSPGGDRDAWIYRDVADGGSNWGIYHRQIDSAVAGLPANSIGFVGGGTNKLQAYINLGDGSAYHAGPLRTDAAVGIGSGQAVLPAKLSLGMDLNNTKLALHDNPSDLYGFGIQAGQLRIHCGSAGARISFLNASAGTEVMTIQGNGRVGIGIPNPAVSLAIGGMGSCIELGAGVANKEVSAGQISYGRHEPGNSALELVGGGGPSSATRRITMWAEGGLKVYGPITTNTDLTVGAGANGSLKARHVNGKQAGNDGDDPLYLNWATGKPVVVNRPEQPAGMELYGALYIRNNAPGAIRIADQSAPNNSFGIYFENGNHTIVFYHNSGKGQFMRQDGVWQQNSDASLKENVTELSGLLDKVVQLRPVSFDWKGSTDRGIGFVAQDVQPIFPEMVSEHTGQDGGPVKGLPYSTFGVLAVGAIKEMKRRYDERIEALEKQVRDLQG